MSDNVTRALACANYLRRLGLTPLPSRSDDKRPDLKSFAQFFDGEPVPESVYAEWTAQNIQVLTGVRHAGRTKLAVVDLDGDVAPDVWAMMCKANDYEPTSAWITRTGSGGTHLWYRLPSGTAECPSGLIWGVWDTWGENGKGKWLKHQEVRILGDGALVVTPPSIHVETDERYRFMPGCSPKEFHLPEVAPAWLLAMPRLTAPRLNEPKPPPVLRRQVPSGLRYERGEVLSAIGDRKVGLLESWGLKLESRRANTHGWVSCYVPFREEPGRSEPSGSVHAEDGTFMDMKDRSKMSFFDLAALLQPGMFPRWTDCRDYCGDRYIGRSRRN